MLIGRDHSCDFVIEDPEISSKHAYVSPVTGGISIEDVGSTNGTYVNGHRVTWSELVESGDQLKLGKTVLEVRMPTPAPAPAPAPAAGAPQKPPVGAEVPVPRPAVTRVRRIPTEPVLAFVAGARAGEEVAVDSYLVVGRDPGAADLILADDTQVSRRHATFS